MHSISQKWTMGAANFHTWSTSTKHTPARSSHISCSRTMAYSLSNVSQLLLFSFPGYSHLLFSSLWIWVLGFTFGCFDRSFTGRKITSALRGTRREGEGSFWLTLSCCTVILTQKSCLSAKIQAYVNRKSLFLRLWFWAQATGRYFACLDSLTVFRVIFRIWFRGAELLSDAGLDLVASTN